MRRRPVFCSIVDDLGAVRQAFGIQKGPGCGQSAFNNRMQQSGRSFSEISQVLAMSL